MINWCNLKRYKGTFENDLPNGYGKEIIED
mgnify:FL=1